MVLWICQHERQAPHFTLFYPHWVSGILMSQQWCDVLCLMFVQAKEDASVHARVCSHAELPGADGGAALEQEHHR